MRNFRWEVLLIEGMRVRIAWATMLAAWLGIGSGVFMIPLQGESEPVGRTFEGRSLQEWLMQLESDSESVEVARALHGMGPAALLRIVEDLQAEDPVRWRASLALRLLGPAAAPVVPRLIEMASSEAGVAVAVGALRDIGPAACTPDSVRVLAGLALRDGNDAQARIAVRTLGEWGTRAAAAIPELLRGLRAQTAAGGPTLRASQIPPPDFARALSVIGVDHREVLVELLGVRQRGFDLVHIHRWLEGSKEGEELLAEVIVDAAVPVASRAKAIRFLNTAHLLPQVPVLLEEPVLRPSIADYLHRLGPPGWAMYPAILEVLKRSQPLDAVFCQRALHWIAQDGRSQPEVFVPMLLPLTFDVRAPYNFGYSNEDALALGEIPLASQAWGALMNLTQDPAPYEAALRHSDWEVRNASASLFSRQGDLSTNVVQELARCMQDAHPWVRLAAAVPLVRVPGYEGAVLSNLLVAIPDQELPAPLRRAAISLAGLPQLQAEKSLPTVRVLKVAVGDPDPRVRDAARRLLERIQGLDGAAAPSGEGKDDDGPDQVGAEDITGPVRSGGDAGGDAEC